jgi:two-component system chemotaxis response regulator CheB
MIRVLVVDDSAVVRKVLSEELSRFKDIEVVGSAIDPYQAREKIVQTRPDVLTLDLEMPRMDGLSFLAKLMKHHPLPVVIVSSLAPENSENALRALELGAVEIVPKPSTQFSVPDVGRHLVRAVRAASKARIGKKKGSQAAQENTVVSAPRNLDTTHKVVAIGASTGGTQAIEKTLSKLPPQVPGIVIVQHMPPGFTASFAERLDQLSPVHVREARDKDIIVPGQALLAPGGQHMLVRRSGTRYTVQIKDGPPVNRHKPSVDVLFHSLAESAGHNSVGVILTGMGADGAKGLHALRSTGAHTIAQDEASSVVFGMPKAAIDLGAVDEVLPLSEVPRGVIRSLDGRVTAAAS